MNQNQISTVSLIRLAPQFWAVSQKQQGYMKRIITTAQKQKIITTPEELREALAIQPQAWAWFLEEYTEGRATRFNGQYHYGQVQTDRPFASVPNYAKYMEQLGKKSPKPGELEGLEVEPGEAPKANAGAAQLAKARQALAKKRGNAIAENKLLKEQIKLLADELEDIKAHPPVVEPQVTVIEIHKDGADPKRIDMVHKVMPELLVRVQCGINVFLTGPAGSGKTTAAEQVADALEIPFGFMSVGPQTTKSDVFGYMSAVGDYVATQFRKCYEHGGVFLFDEMDAGHAGVLTQVNAALAGSCAAFPDQMVKKHDDFRCIGAGNTFGTGPDRQYVGRQPLDAASLDRFDFLEWGYDEALEMAIAKSLARDTAIAERWTKFVQAIRAAIQDLGIRHVVSPRATINGVKLLEAGVEQDRVQATTLWKSLKPNEIDRITSKAGVRVA